MKKYFLLVKNNKGVALVYVLMALIFVSAISSLVLNLAKNESADTSLRVSSESARYSAVAGLTYATNLFASDTTGDTLVGSTGKTTVQFLNAWYKNYEENDGSIQNMNDAGLIWIKGSENSYPIEQDGMKFRVKVVNIDFSELKKVTPPADDGVSGRQDSWMSILFESEGLDKSGSRARVFGSYKVFGYEKDKKVSKLPQSALYMGSGIDEIDVVVDIDGATFLKGGGAINHPGHNFREEFKRKGAAGELILRAATFWGPAYFGTMVGAPSSSVRIESGKSTFENGLASESYLRVIGYNGPIVKGGAFLNGDAVCENTNGDWRFLGESTRLRGLNGRSYGSGLMWDGTVTNSGLQYLYSAAPSDAPQISSIESNPMNLYDSLGISEDDPYPIDIDYSPLNPYINILTSINGKVNNITGEDLNNLYNTYTGSMYNGWMVIKLHPNGRPFSDAGNGFDHKMVLIIDAQCAASGFGTTFYKSGESGNSLIIVEDGVSTSQLGHDTLIRGLIVNLGAGDLRLQSRGQNMKVQGAIYSVGNGQFRLEGGAPNKITIEYDVAALTEINNELPGVVIIGGDNKKEIISLERIKDEANNGIPPTCDFLSRSF